MRNDWDSYFMEIAKVVSTRATCPRKRVGAVLVRDRIILCTGYNGSVRGMPHCADVGCMMDNGVCIRTVHAEVNAISQAARRGVAVDGATLYCTYSPCLTCLKQIINSGIQRVVFAEAYHGLDVQDGLMALRHNDFSPGFVLDHLTIASE